MDEQIKALVSQIRILESEANNKHTPAERTALFRAAGKLKNQVATLLNQQQGQQQGQQHEPKVPGLDYFDNLTPDMNEYFKNSLTPEMESYFNNLTPEMEQYFATPDIQNFDNAPSAKPEPARTHEFSDWETRRKILNAIGIPC